MLIESAYASRLHGALEKTTRECGHSCWDIIDTASEMGAEALHFIRRAHFNGELPPSEWIVEQAAEIWEFWSDCDWECDAARIGEIFADEITREGLLDWLIDDPVGAISLKLDVEANDAWLYNLDKLLVHSYGRRIEELAELLLKDEDDED